jgi:hypothetical protein
LDRILIEGKFPVRASGGLAYQRSCAGQHIIDSYGFCISRYEYQKMAEGHSFLSFSPGQVSAPQRFGCRIMLMVLLVCDRNASFRTKTGY